MLTALLKGVIVIDASSLIAGPYCAKLLADYGADVIKIESPRGGDPARRLPFPSAPGITDGLSGAFVYLNNNKRSVTIDPRKSQGRDLFLGLVARADILVEDYGEDRLKRLNIQYRTLAAVNPRLVMTSLSWFGNKGPYSCYKGDELVIQAAAGVMNCIGDASREPLQVGFPLSEYSAGLMAATGSLLALWQAKQKGVGQQVDISIMESTFNILCYPTVVQQLTGRPVKRRRFYPGIMRCRDGYVGINILTYGHWEALCQWMRREDLLDNPVYAKAADRSQRSMEITGIVARWAAKHTKDYLFREGQAHRIPVGIVNTLSDLPSLPQFVARRYMVPVRHPVLGKVMQPGAPFHADGYPWRIERPAPTLGQHNDEVFRKMLGHTRSDIERWRATGVI